MLRSPKERFIASTQSGPWGRITNGEVFEEAARSAFDQLSEELPIDCSGPQQACDSYQQLVGARKYMEILSSLHVPLTPPKTTQPKGLDYSAGV